MEASELSRYLSYITANRHELILIITDELEALDIERNGLSDVEKEDESKYILREILEDRFLTDIPDDVYDSVIAEIFNDLYADVLIRCDFDSDIERNEYEEA